MQLEKAMNHREIGIKFLITLFFVCLTSFFYSQELFLKKVNISDGLLGYDNYGIIEDANGAIWASSENGVVKLKGDTYKRFTSADGLLTNDVWRMAIDPEGRIWLRSYAAGIQYIYGDKIHTVKNSKQYDEIQFSGYHRDTCFFNLKIKGRQKRYFLDGDGALKHYNRFNSLGYEVKGDFAKYGFFLLSKTENNIEMNYYYWLKTGKVESTYSQLSNINSREFIDESPIFRCYSGKMLGKYPTALYIPTKMGFKPVLEDLWSEVSFRDIHNFDNKNVVINVKGNIQVFSSVSDEKRNHEIEQIIDRHFESPRDIGGALQDRMGNLWLLHLRGELFFVHSAAFWANSLDFSDEKNWNTEVYHPVQWKEEGQFIYITYKGEVCYYNYLTGEKKLLHHFDGAIREIKLLNDQLYILQPNGIVVLSLKGQFNSIKVEKSKIYYFDFEMETAPLAFEFIHPQKILLSSGYIIELLPNLKLKPEKIENFEPLFRTEKIILIGNLIACCSNTKCYFFDLKKKKELKVEINSPSCINYIEGHLFIGTYGNGCYKLDLATRKLIHVFNSKEDVLNVLYKDALYLCTSNGVLVGQIQNDVFRATKSYLNHEYFSLRSNDLVIGNKIVVLTNRGVVIADPFKKLQLQQKCETLNGIKFELLARNAGKRIFPGTVIEYNNNNVSFSFKDNSFFDISSTTYRYKLVGYSNAWNYTKNGTISFSKLRTGDYKLIVESSFSQYGTFRNRKSFDFRVSKPFYAKEVFIIGAIVLALVVLILANYLVRSFAFKRAQRVSKLKELEYQALQAQLNPHFVFNCLNNLQRMMILSDEREVNEYICSFAGLMRNVLDNSKRKKITLQEEIELLENYLRIEQIRLSGTLNYSIQLSDNIDPSIIEIYGMVFQPFVENAIIHGFMTNQANKQITIEFVLLETNVLLGTVIDNGIGREKAQLLKKKGVYKSWASTILKEKSELLNITRRNELSFEIIDLYSNNSSIGTKVEVKMRID